MFRHHIVLQIFEKEKIPFCNSILTTTLLLLVEQPRLHMFYSERKISCIAYRGVFTCSGTIAWLHCMNLLFIWFYGNYGRALKTRRGVYILPKFQLPSSYGLDVMMFWRFGGKGSLTHCFNEWMNEWVTKVIVEQLRLHEVC